MREHITEEKLQEEVLKKEKRKKSLNYPKTRMTVFKILAIKCSAQTQLFSFFFSPLFLSLPAKQFSLQLCLCLIPGI